MFDRRSNETDRRASHDTRNTMAEAREDCEVGLAREGDVATDTRFGENIFK